MNFHVEDFTEYNYRNLIELGKENSQFHTFESYKSLSSGIIMRHDIDMSVHRALALAKIEQDEGIQSTYFIYLHSQFYNILEKEIHNIILKIINTGAEIGLHFDPGFYDDCTDAAHLEHKIAEEKHMLELLFNIPVKVLSFHNPDAWRGGRLDKLEQEYFGGLLNVYCPYINSNYEYCSDSNGYWRYKRLEDVLSDSTNKKLHILTHPVWWTEQVMMPRDRVLTAVNGRAGRVMNEYDAILDKCNRVNVRGR